jgi:hypothetical protein
MIHTLIFITLGAWAFTEFEPLQKVLAHYLANKGKTLVGDLKNFILQVLSCWTCLTFWACLAGTLSLFGALAAGFAAWAIQKILR